MPPVPPFYDSEVEVERYGSIAFSYNSVLQSNQSWTFHVMASESPGASYLNMYLGTVLVHVDRRFVYSIGVLYYRRPVESNRRIQVTLIITTKLLLIQSDLVSLSLTIALPKA